jgi:hypothetical protein
LVSGFETSIVQENSLSRIPILNFGGTLGGLEGEGGGREGGKEGRREGGKRKMVGGIHKLIQSKPGMSSSGVGK